MAGRKPKLEADNKTLHRSNAELKAREEATPVYESQHFIAPTTLTDKELEVWNWLVGIFRETVNCKVSDADVHLMELYCRAKVATDEAHKELKEDERYYIPIEAGYDKLGDPKIMLKVNPNYKKRLDNANLCLRYFDQLGLSPLARARAGVRGANAKNEMDIFSELMNRSDD